MQVSKDELPCITGNCEYRCVLRLITLIMKMPITGKMGRK